MKINRFQAFAGHLLGSVIVALCSAALVFVVWYPGHMPFATGVTDIFVLLLSVDVVIGPCITLVVFNTAKKELKRDLAIVLLLQMMALLYGLHSVYVARPVYLVFNANRFDLVFANDLSPEKLNKVSNIDFRSIPFWGPKVIAARMPDDSKKEEEILFNAFAGGDDLPQMPQYYLPYYELKSQVLERMRPLEELNPFNKEREAEIAALVNKYRSIKEGVGFLPLRGKVADLTVIVRKDSAEILEINDVKPWL